MKSKIRDLQILLQKEDLFGAKNLCEDLLRNQNIDDAKFYNLYALILFKLNNYEQSIRFANLIATLAESQDHHPKITLEWGSVSIEWWSHKIKGLHMNDFICAAKSDEIFDAL